MRLPDHAPYTHPSERQLVEQIDHNLLFRWLAGFSMDGRG